MKTIIILLFISIGCSTRHHERSATVHLATNPDTKLFQRFKPLLESHKEESGVYPLVNGEDALVSRVLAIRSAERSIDLQYYLWNNDYSGKMLIKEVIKAADRGVRIQFLLDSYFEVRFVTALKMLDQHDNIEVRLINPGLRFINRRMHNKSFTVDNQLTIVGGRNIGDGYFESSVDHNYKDFEVLLIGSQVDSVANQFDKYWNSKRSFSMHELDRLPVEARDVKKTEKEMAKILPPKISSTLEHKFNNPREEDFYWGHVRVLYDPPEKLEKKDKENLSQQLRPGLMETEKELILISPYFIPGKKGMKSLKELRANKVDVIVVTNSLQSNDNMSVFSGYKDYREELLKMGVKLYELKRLSLHEHADNLGSSGATGLHGKVLIRDQKMIFVGSMNIDPRSRTLNTEMGAQIRQPILAKKVADKLMEGLPEIAYRLEWQDHGIVWIEKKAETMKVHKKEPGSSKWKDIKSDISSFLVPEQLL